jgi:demethylmenaquinone methyltransferase/2-methoxy-6-polyprenyl-1,4-benzoquinol methylase
MATQTFTNASGGDRYPLQAFYSRIYKTYDLVNTLFTFGLDKKWRDVTVSKCLSDKPKQVLDLCCGTGDLAIRIAKKSAGQTQVTGYDLNAEMLQIAERKALKENVNIPFIQGDAGSMPFESGIFDSITIGFGFRNLTWQNPACDRYIREISRVLKPGGKLFILESARPENHFIAFFYSLYLKLILVPLGGIFSGDWTAYRYLAGSSAGFYTYDELKRLLREVQLNLHSRKTFIWGAANLLTATKQ